MDFKSNKINQPFNPNSNYFQGLSNNIQSRVGIEVKNVVETKAPIIEFNKKQKPIQLTVEFGFPLTAEKNIAVESNQNQDEEVVETNIATNQIIDSSDNLVKDDEIGQIHIEPIQLAANVNPYWHNFNSDDELEGLVLDSEGQEMSDITINGDAMFDIDHHFLQKGKSEIVVTEVPAVINEIIETLPVVKEIDFVASEESPIEIENTVSVVINDELPENSIISVVNNAEMITNDISSVVGVDDNQVEEALFSFSFAPEISRLSGIRVDLIRTIGWAISGAAGATAGILQTTNGSGSVAPDSFEFILLLIFGFVAAVIGGIESLIGAVVGALTLGVILAIILMYLGSSLVFFAAFVILILVLLLRPNGIIGVKGGRRA